MQRSWPPTSRRGLLAATGAALLAVRARPVRAMAEEHLAYVAGGKGITLFHVNTGNGAMTRLSVAAPKTVSWLACNQPGHMLYAVAPGEPDGSVSTFAIEHGSGALTRRNSVGARGPAPGHVAVHPSNRFVLVAHAGGGVAVFPVDDSGALGEASDMQGQAVASAPCGMVAADPQGRFILATDAAADRLLRYSLDVTTGKLAPAGDPVAVAPGSAPGRFVFAPKGRMLYVLHERTGIVASYDYDADTAALKPVQQVSVLPPGYAGAVSASDLAITADGRFLYASVRVHDAIAVFAVGEGGRLTPIGEAWTRADGPASFTVSPDGSTLFACDTLAGTITSFRISRLSGAVDFVGKFAAVEQPTCMVFAG